MFFKQSHGHTCRHICKLYSCVSGRIKKTTLPGFIFLLKTLSAAIQLIYKARSNASTDVKRKALSANQHASDTTRVAKNLTSSSYSHGLLWLYLLVSYTWEKTKDKRCPECLLVPSNSKEFVLGPFCFIGVSGNVDPTPEVVSFLLATQLSFSLVVAHITLILAVIWGSGVHCSLEERVH